MGGRADHYRVGFGFRLHSRGNVWRLTEGKRLFAASRANHDCAGMDSDAHLQRRTVPTRFVVQASDRIDDRQSGPRRPLGIVFMRLGPTEVSHHSVTEKLGDVAAEARNRLCRPRDDNPLRVLAIPPGPAAPKSRSNPPDRRTALSDGGALPRRRREVLVSNSPARHTRRRLILAATKLRLLRPHHSPVERRTCRRSRRSAGFPPYTLHSVWRAHCRNSRRSYW